VDNVLRVVGLSIDFHPTTGEPAIAYLGGGSDGNPFWLNSDGKISRRSGTAWTGSIVVTNGATVTCGNPVSDTAAGVVVGLWPALRYDGTGNLHCCYRDVHSGQFPQQDWAGSDVECWYGVPGAMTGSCTKAGGNDRGGWGGRIQMAMSADQPTIIYDAVFGGADTSGQNVFLQQRSDAGSWTLPPAAVASVAATQTGASLAIDAVEGTGVAVLDEADNVLRYYRRAPTAMIFAPADAVFGMGRGGWYPSLAMDPVNHEPAIGYYVCAPNVGMSPCLASYDEVRVAQRNTVSSAWQETTVDTEAGERIRLGFLPNGKRVLAYRRPGTGEVVLAVEQ
jgi:hypothetical protein